MNNPVKIFPSCPLCRTPADISLLSMKKRTFYRCPSCRGYFMATTERLNPEQEEAYYLTHENNIEDAGYRNFVSPIVNAACTNHPPGSTGLDFGAGTGPVIAAMLEEKNYNMFLYDLYFHNHSDNLERQYDFIACCEVMEHFSDPLKEFTLLYNLLKPGGYLYCMTQIYSEEIIFSNWYYTKDPTHIFIYQKETIAKLSEMVGFSRVEINNRLIIFQK